MRRTRRLAGPVLLVPLLAGCASPVDPSTADTSPPQLNLDAFGIPVQPGASSQPNPESLDPACCDVTRVVKPGPIDLLAGADDLESGIRIVSIWVSDTTTCVHADGNAASTGPGGLGGPAAHSPAVPPTATPTSAPDHLLVQHGLTIPQRPSTCVQFFGTWHVYAQALNYAGQTAQTKRFTFRLTLP